MEFDPEEYNFVEVFVPKLTLLSPYTIDGKVFFIPIQGHGNTNFTFGKQRLAWNSSQEKAHLKTLRNLPFREHEPQV